MLWTLCPIHRHLWTFSIITEYYLNGSFLSKLMLACRWESTIEKSSQENLLNFSIRKKFENGWIYNNDNFICILILFESQIIYSWTSNFKQLMHHHLWVFMGKSDKAADLICRSMRTINDTGKNYDLDSDLFIDWNILSNKQNLYGYFVGR